MSEQDPTPVGIAALAAADFRVIVDRGYADDRIFDSAESADLWRGEIRRLARAEKVRIETYRTRRPSQSGRWLAIASLRTMSAEQAERMHAETARKLGTWGR